MSDLKSECTTSTCSNSSDYYCSKHREYVCCNCCDDKHSDCSIMSTKTLKDVDAIARYIKYSIQNLKFELKQKSHPASIQKQFDSFYEQFQTLVGDLICAMADKENADWDDLYSR